MKDYKLKLRNLRASHTLGGLDFGFWPILITKFSITAIAVIENLWSHGRGKVMTKHGSRFCVPNNRKSRKNKKTFGGEKW